MAKRIKNPLKVLYLLTGVRFAVLLALGVWNPSKVNTFLALEGLWITFPGEMDLAGDCCCLPMLYCGLLPAAAAAELLLLLFPLRGGLTMAAEGGRLRPLLLVVAAAAAAAPRLDEGERK